MLIVLGATLGGFLWVTSFFSPDHTASFSDSNSVRNFITCEIAISPRFWQNNPSGEERRLFLQARNFRIRSLLLKNMCNNYVLPL